MNPILILLALKLVTLLASIASTLGLVSFVFFDTLHPYRWHLLVGGMICTVVTEALSGLIAKRLGARAGSTGG